MHLSVLVHWFSSWWVLGVPLPWKKTGGGEGPDVTTWIGLEIHLREFRLGISARRATCLSRWAGKVAASGQVNISTMEEGLGRMMFVAGVLDHIRPCLAPIAVKSRASPRYVAVFLRSLEFLKGQESRIGEDGTPRAGLSASFPENITSEVLSWVVELDSQPARVMATLEALAMVVALRCSDSRDQARRGKRITLIPTQTDKHSTS